MLDAVEVDARQSAAEVPQAEDLVRHHGVVDGGLGLGQGQLAFGLPTAFHLPRPGLCGLHRVAEVRQAQRRGVGGDALAPGQLRFHLVEAPDVGFLDAHGVRRGVAHRHHEQPILGEEVARQLAACGVGVFTRPKVGGSE